MPKFKYMIDYRVSGTFCDVIETDETQEELEKRLDNEVNDDDWSPELDTIDDVDFRISKMTLVKRDDDRVWTTYVRATDKVVD